MNEDRSSPPHAATEGGDSVTPPLAQNTSPDDKQKVIAVIDAVPLAEKREDAYASKTFAPVNRTARLRRPFAVRLRPFEKRALAVVCALGLQQSVRVSHLIATSSLDISNFSNSQRRGSWKRGWDTKDWAVAAIPVIVMLLLLLCAGVAYIIVLLRQTITTASPPPEGSTDDTPHSNKVDSEAPEAVGEEGPPGHGHCSGAMASRSCAVGELVTV